MVDGFKIIGGKPLKGIVKISGSKNAALPILAATLLAEGEFVLDNIPELQDIKNMFELLKSFGLKISQIEKNKYLIVNEGIKNVEADYSIVKKMRASFLVMGPLLTKEKKAKVSLPGGCAIGARPVNYHLSAFEKMGASINIKHGYVNANISDEFCGQKIFFDFPSVGATENIMMAATLAKGETIITNAARDPEVEDLANFLVAMGAQIDGIASSTLKIKGIKKLKACNYKVIPDRIEAGTFIIASILNKGNIVIENANLKHLEKFIEILKDMGVELSEKENKVFVENFEELKPVHIKTAAYPGFSTDLQAQILLLLTMTKGESTLKETVFENRFMHVSELDRMGANISIDCHTAIISETTKLYGSEVMVSDLRAGASLVLAGLIAHGETIVNRVYHIDRGYENLEDKLKILGADIERIKIGA